VKKKELEVLQECRDGTDVDKVPLHHLRLEIPVRDVLCVMRRHDTADGYMGDSRGEGPK
jgi:hypothetical protein